MHRQSHTGKNEDNFVLPSVSALWPDYTECSNFKHCIQIHKAVLVGLLLQHNTDLKKGVREYKCHSNREEARSPNSIAPDKKVLQSVTATYIWDIRERRRADVLPVGYITLPVCVLLFCVGLQRRRGAPEESVSVS